MVKRKPKRIQPTKENLALMEKVKGQLAELKKPFWVRGPQEEGPTIEEYKLMDPYWQSTMGGQFAGRVIGAKDE